MLKNFILILLLCSVLLQADNFGDGVRAYKKGDFAKARVLFEFAIKQDKAIHANYMLGRMYLNGQGVPNDVDKAIKLLKRAFEAGNIPAGCYVSEAYMKKGANSALLAEGLVSGLRKRVPHCKKVFAQYKVYSFPSEFHYN